MLNLVVLEIVVTKRDFAGSTGSIKEAAFGFFPENIVRSGGLHDAMNPDDRFFRFKFPPGTL